LSTQGVYSNRGDYYQKLIAFKWAIKVLRNPEYEWLEIDSIKYPLVDDVVIQRQDGILICCQCKKNQTNHSNWTFNDLKDELKKAFILLSERDDTLVIFYSRTSFGKLSKIREYSEGQADEISFLSNLPEEYSNIYKQLNSLAKEIKPDLSIYYLIKKITFSVTDDYQYLEEKLKEELQNTINNSHNVFNEMFFLIERTSSRIQRTDSFTDNLNSAPIFNM